jgi:hypothetical protein
MVDDRQPTQQLPPLGVRRPPLESLTITRIAKASATLGPQRNADSTRGAPCRTGIELSVRSWRRAAQYLSGILGISEPFPSSLRQPIHERALAPRNGMRPTIPGYAPIAWLKIMWTGCKWLIHPVAPRVVTREWRNG